MEGKGERKRKRERERERQTDSREKARLKKGETAYVSVSRLYLIIHNHRHLLELLTAGIVKRRGKVDARCSETSVVFFLSDAFPMDFRGATWTGARKAADRINALMAVSARSRLL